MGCDIHEYREKKVNGEWITADTWETEEDGYMTNDCPYLGRNYTLFGFLAGVRIEVSEGLGEPKGLPDDVSTEVKQASDYWGSDGHSHSWVLVSDIKEHLAKLLIEPTEASEYYEGGLRSIVEMFKDIDGEDHRFVFWFDN